MKKTSLIAIAAAAALVPSLASAADLGGNCCADLEERVAELEATTARKGNKKVSLTVSGQVGESILFWDDGLENNVYVGSHDYARTRFRFIGSAKINSEWTAGYHLEIGVRTARNNRLTADTDESQALDLRFSNWYLQSSRLGKVTVGQASSATDGITEINLSNAAGLAFVQLPDMLASGNAGFRFTNNGGRSARGWGDLFPGQGASGQIGEGDRWNVVRYDTPSIMGFIASAAWGEDDMWDVALRYAGEFNGIKIGFGVGYGQYSDSNLNVSERGCAIAPTGQQECSHLGLSASVMHVPTGIYVSAAYGRKKDDSVDALAIANGLAGADDTYEMLYVQAGIEQKWTPLGKTTIFGDYHKYDLGQGLGTTTGPTTAGATLLAVGAADALGVAGFITGAEVKAYGGGIVQNIEAAAMDLYIYYKHVEADLNITNAGVTTKVSPNDHDMVLMGAVIKF